MTEPDNSEAVLIAGPTASGKSQAALDIAARITATGRRAAVVNTDSMQVYPVLRILTARPDDADLAVCDHALYGHAALDEPYSVGRWTRDVADYLGGFERGETVPIFTGGTGLYFRALTEGLSPIPEIAPEIRAEVRVIQADGGAAALHDALMRHDAAGAAALRPSDTQRLARALEVVLSTGKPLAYFQQQTGRPLLDGWEMSRLIVEPERGVLHERIDRRADMMIEQGALEEVRTLLALDLPQEATVLKAIGVLQLGDVLRGERNLDDAISSMKSATRQYAKRQSTWFRGQMGADWRRADAQD